MVSEAFILNLLRNMESPTLEFKSQWYKLDDDNREVARRQKGELIKDVLSLANGNADVAGETSYLVIGVTDEIDGQGERGIVGVSDTEGEGILADRILKIVNTVCSPALESLVCDNHVLNEKTIVVITISPSPHLHEITSELRTQNRLFTEFTVFVRHGEQIRIASTSERITIGQLKKLRFQEIHNVPPLQFGAVVGATIGGLIFSSTAAQALGTNEVRMAGFIVGSIVGGVLGGIFGSVIRDSRYIRRYWKHTRLWVKATVVFIFAVVLILLVFILEAGDPTRIGNLDIVDINGLLRQVIA